MAIAEVGAGTQRNVVDTTTAVDSHTVAFPGNVTAGSLLINVGSGWRATAPYTACAVTDTLGTLYTAVMGDFIFWSGGFGVGWIAYGIAPSSGPCTQTVNPNVGTGTIVSACDEFTGVDATPLDVDGGQSTGTSTTPSDGIVTGVDGALVIGLMSQATGGTITPAGGLTAIFEKESGAGQPAAAAFKIGVTAGAETMAWTLSNSRLWNVHTLSFKPAAVPAAETNFVFNVAKGRVGGVYDRVVAADPPNCALVLVALDAAGLETDAVLKKKDTLADVLSGATNEVTNSGYARKVLVAADLTPLAPDHTNDRLEIVLPNQTWSTVSAGAAWAKLLVCFRPDTASSDSAIIPLTAHGFVRIPNGTDLGAVLAGGIWRVA